MGGVSCINVMFFPLPSMKSLFTTLLIAAGFGSAAFALDASNAQVTLTKISSLEFAPITAPKVVSFGEKQKKSLKRESKHGWHFISVPVEVQGKAKNDKVPDFVDALDFTLYVLVDMGGDSKPAILKKELRYVDIPLVKDKSGMKGKINIGAFITPSDVSKLSADSSKATEGGSGDLQGKILGVAVEATFEGEDCMSTKMPSAYVFDAAMKKKLKSNWWKSSTMTSSGVTMLGINETPFAPFYAAHFPMMDPVYSSESTTKDSSNPTSEE